jgi:hypothetical protein
MRLFRKNDSKTEHQWVEERLSAYLDGELSSRERDAVEHHLARCEDCRWNLRTLRQTVRLTKELPSVPVPRVFTIPAPAQKPVAVRQRRWGVGMLQGATALVALLLVFAVAGDFMLSGVMPASRSEPQVMKEQAVVETMAVEVEVTREVELEAPSPTVPEAEVTAEKAVSVEATPSPEPRLAAPAVPPPSEPMRTMAPTPTPEVTGLGAAGFDTPTTEPQEPTGGGTVTEAPRMAAPVTEATLTPEATPEAGAAVAPEAVPEAEAALAPEATSATETGQAYTTLDTAEPAPTMPPEPSSEEEPTIVAAAPALAQRADQEQAGERGAGATREPLIAWIETTEIVLGAAFVLLATATIVAMIRRRSAR